MTTKTKPAVTAKKAATPPVPVKPTAKKPQQKTLAKWTTEDETLMFSLVKDDEGDLMLSVEDLQNDNDDAIVTLATTVSELDEAIELLQSAKVRMMRAEGDSGPGDEDEDEDDDEEEEDEEDEEEEEGDDEDEDE